MIVKIGDGNDWVYLEGQIIKISQPEINKIQPEEFCIKFTDFLYENGKTPNEDCFFEKSYKIDVLDEKKQLTRFVIAPYIYLMNDEGKTFEKIITQ